MGIRILKKNFIAKIPIHPSFFLLLLWFLLFKDIISFIVFFTVVSSHEFGHYIIAKKLGYKLDNFYIAPYGASLNYKEKVFSYKDEILIACGGPAVNLIFSILCVALWWIFPVLYNYLNEFVFQSFMLCLLNLLPCYPLDGGRIFVGILSNNMPRKKAIKIIYNLNYIFSILIIISFIVMSFISFNPTLCICGCFLLLSSIDSKFEAKYQPNIFLKKNVKNFSRPFFVIIEATTPIGIVAKHIETNRETIFIINIKNKTIFVSENQIKDYLLNYPFNTQIQNCIILNKE